MASPHSLGVPSFDQVWLLALEFQAEIFRVRLDIFRGRIVMLLQEGINSSAIQGHQWLNLVVAVDSGAMIGRRKFVECFYPEFVFVTELPVILVCDSLKFCVSIRREYRPQDVRQLCGAA